MPIQTTYSSTMTVGRPGQVADMRNRTVVSREVLATSASIAFGAPVLRDAVDHGCAAVGTAGAGGFLGIAIADATVRPGNLDTFAPFDTAAVMLKGIVWVTVAAASAPGSPAYFDASGNITSASTGNTAIANGTFETTAAAGGLVQLRLA